MGTIDLRGDGVNTEMETGSRSTAAPIVAHRASWSEKFRGTPLTEANQAIQAYAWTVGQLSVAKLPHSPTTQPQPDISFATESGHLHLLLTLFLLSLGARQECEDVQAARDGGLRLADAPDVNLFQRQRSTLRAAIFCPKNGEHLHHLLQKPDILTCYRHAHHSS